MARWSKNLTNLPALTFQEIDTWADEQVGIPKRIQQKGYSNWIEGYIHDVEVRAEEGRTNANTVMVRAKAYPSMRKNEQAYRVQVELSSRPTDQQIQQIQQTSCACKAGLGHCSHLIGLLYTLAHYAKLGYKSVPITKSKTSLPQTWHIPSRELGLQPKPVTLLKINKIKSNKTYSHHSSVGLQKNYGIGPKLYSPIPLPLPSESFASSLLDNLKSIQSNSQMLRLLENNTGVKYIPTEFGNLPFGSPLTYQTLTTPDLSNDLPTFICPAQPSDYSYVLPSVLSEIYDSFKISSDQALQLEEETRLQNNSSLWHDVRSQRLTASNFKRICSRRADFEFLATVLQKKTIQTQAMKRGIELEPVAAKLYSDITRNEIFPCGFVININAPHLGCTPDRRVTDLNSDPCHGLLEIKCPNQESYTNCAYLKTVGGTFSLKDSHEYYFQVMGQMALTGAKWCDFFVMCKEDYHLERVHFDAVFWKEMKTKLDQFFFEYFLPTLGY